MIAIKFAYFISYLMRIISSFLISIFITYIVSFVISFINQQIGLCDYEILTFSFKSIITLFSYIVIVSLIFIPINLHKIKLKTWFELLKEKSDLL